MDNLDRRIIDQLRQNSRAAYGDIGGVIGLSASAVKRRVDRLMADGVIRGFTIHVDPSVEGLETEAYVELFCRGTVAPDELRRLLEGVPDVVDAGTVSGCRHVGLAPAGGPAAAAGGARKAITPPELSRGA